MSSLDIAFILILTAIGCFGWGMYFQEIATTHKNVKAREKRIIIDAPFSPEQSETIMRVLAELNEAVRQSMLDAGVKTEVIGNIYENPELVKGRDG